MPSQPRRNTVSTATVDKPAETETKPVETDETKSVETDETKPAAPAFAEDFSDIVVTDAPSARPTTKPVVVPPKVAELIAASLNNNVPKFVFTVGWTEERAQKFVAAARQAAKNLKGRVRIVADVVGPDKVPALRVTVTKVKERGTLVPPATPATLPPATPVPPANT